MAYIIGFILFLIALIVVGLILRKRVYDEVDRLENWKMDIMNRNVTSELSRVKDLNLSGETQDKFESWKDRWELILTRELPDIEEYLLDAEEAADRYRISTAKKNLRAVNEILGRIEKSIEQIFAEVDQLMEAEQHTRQEIEDIQPRIKELRKMMIQNRFQYGKAEIRFEVEFDELDGKLQQYFDLTDSGDYTEAQVIVDDLKEHLEKVEYEMEVFPEIYKSCKQTLPTQIDDLFAGLKDMKEEGYRIEQMGFEKELHKFQERLVASVLDLEKGNMSDAIEVSEHIDQRLKEMYQLLEKEALSKNFVEKHFPSYEKLIEDSLKDFQETKDEIESLQHTYYFEDSDLESHLSLEKWMQSIRNQFEEIKEEMQSDKATFVSMRDALEVSSKDLEELQLRHTEYKEQIRTLRKDELEAKGKVHEMRKQLFDTNRKLKKSNIPGVPSYVWGLLTEGSEKLEKVLSNLAKQPLDMGEVQHSLDAAEKAVNAVMEQTNLLLEQAELVELVIQYANRYRSQHAILAAKLLEAEKMFRNYEYENALEQAVQALKEVDPDAIKRLEERKYSELTSS
ncbi:septation ring formation regulator EzrA [Radiobacillus kanasensis]|uniref:septation ring formation regulator EzrA n=1 Tax=Radiobacillus kanasensis TaxID=2844358 RepID=UPI001E312165|nr:septation ring formation regulator EzrA [Radiobacillus kanasensis]UFT98040.1 septation ring formation regulator EzrA [Radiobacillus kanasensis]